MMFYRIAIRDIMIIGASALLAIYAGPYSEGVGPGSDLVGVVVGFFLGASAFVLHGWGHLFGALLTRSTIAAPSSLKSVFLFSFDSKKNSRKQFLVMSSTGFLASALCLWIAFAGLPAQQLATHVARGIVLFFAALTVLLEFPAVLWACVRKDLPPVETFSTERNTQ